MPVDGGTPVQITSTGGVAAEESADGHALYVGRADAVRGLWRVPLDGTPESLVAQGLNQPGNFAVGQQAVHALVVGNLAHHTSVVIVETRTGRQRVVPFGKGMWMGVALSPDERTLLVSAVDTVGNKHGSDLMIVEPE